MVRVAPSSACQAPLRGPRGQDAKGPSLRAACLLSSGGPWPSLSVGLASSLSSLSSGARTQVAVSGRLLGRAPQAGGGGGGGGSAQLVNKGRLGAGRAPSGFNAQWPEGLAASLLAGICIASRARTGARSIGDCEAAVSKKKRPVLKARLAYCNANSIQSRPARAGLPGAPAS